MTREAVANVDSQVSYWKGEIERAKKRYRNFHSDGDTVVDAYRQQKDDGENAAYKDKFNILYSSTETTRPNLYAQAPKARCNLRNRDTANPTTRVAAMLLEGCISYVQQEEDFDELMDSAVEDFLLPGLGQAWVRYEANFKEIGTKEEPAQELLDEMVKTEYVYWQDFLTGTARVWKDVPWVARRLWLTRAKAEKRFGKEKAGQLKYATRDATGRDADNPSETAEAWEIWDKTTRKVFWFAESLTELLDEKDDPLKLKHFFPCPRPLRAISNTRTFVPRALYSQYKSQAETLNTMTKRIRLLSEALRVVGFYDGSQPKLADALNPAQGNRMIAVDSWATFAQNGGIAGSVVWLPIDTVVKTLTELQKARDVAKQEIYEITGFSDIVRGVSKASETLGAQNLKASWAGARVKKMQAEVQRFARDVLALAGELIAEHCSPETIAIFSGLQMPEQNDPALEQKMGIFKGACDVLRDELRRVSVIDIETNSTLLADEESEREDRTKFLAAAGAFLQQAVPAMEATPELGPLLGQMLMFTIRTFPSSRSIEDEFEKVQNTMAEKLKNPEQDKGGEKAKAAAEQQRVQADMQAKAQELQVRQAGEQAKNQLDTVAEQNRHAERMAELALKEREVAIRERELAFKEQELAIKQQDADTKRLAAEAAAHTAAQGLAHDVQAHGDEVALEREGMDRADENADLDRDAQAQAQEAQERQAEADREVKAAEPKEGP